MHDKITCIYTVGSALLLRVTGLGRQQRFTKVTNTKTMKSLFFMFGPSNHKVFSLEPSTFDETSMQDVAFSF